MVFEVFLSEICKIISIFQALVYCIALALMVSGVLAAPLLFLMTIATLIVCFTEGEDFKIFFGWLAAFIVVGTIVVYCIGNNWSPVGQVDKWFNKDSHIIEKM